jgi:predicted amidohydrolase YtcJ
VLFRLFRLFRLLRLFRTTGSFMIFATAAMACGSSPQTGAGDPREGPGPADLVLRGGPVLTMNPDQPEASALAVRGDRVVAVGSEADIAPFIGPATRVIELQGRTVTPGLVDGHCHLYGLGSVLESVPLRGVTSPQEAARLAGKAAADLPAGEWITGYGWDQNLWTPKEFPHHGVLDQTVPDRPVSLHRIDGHALWANAAAMKLAGVSVATRDPEGGRIVRDDKGAPTGVFIDEAMGLIESHIPAPDAAVLRRRIARAAKLAIASGLTGVHEMGIDDAIVAVYTDMAAAGELPLRVQAYLSGDAEVVAGLAGRQMRPDSGMDYFSLRGVKVFADGALGSRGAALLEPYSDDPGNKGLMITPPEVLERMAGQVADAGWQLATHAIGDAANRAVLDAYETALRAHPDKDLRFRVEHVQVVAPADVPRFAALGVLASMQPTHATSDMPWAGDRLGAERVRGAYAWRSLLDSGARIVAGSDFPVEEVPPLLGLYAAVTRQDREGKPAGGWYPDQRMTLAEVVRAFTVEPAFAAFVEQHRGALRPGHAADITVYDRALTEEALLQAGIDMTVVGGRIVFERE